MNYLDEIPENLESIREQAHPGAPTGSGMSTDNANSRNIDMVDTVARVAVYDSMLASPKIIDIQPNSTREYIGELASTIYSQAKAQGGSIPYSVILQVTENFIHSYFTEVVVSIMDSGDTIRFSDQGPGIIDKKKACEPGFSSATSEMKRYIHGVGSGLPIVSEYMTTMHGKIEIEDNLMSGAVITISLVKDASSDTNNQTNNSFNNPLTSKSPSSAQNDEVSIRNLVYSMVSERGLEILNLFKLDDVWRVTDIASELNLAPSTTYNELKKLEEADMLTKLGKKRILTDIGRRFINEDF